MPNSWFLGKDRGSAESLVKKRYAQFHKIILISSYSIIWHLLTGRTLVGVYEVMYERLHLSKINILPTVDFYLRC